VGPLYRNGGEIRRATQTRRIKVMAMLHSALQCLGPTRFDDVPITGDLRSYIQGLLVQCRLIVESVPPPPPSSPTNYGNCSATDHSGAGSSSADIFASDILSVALCPTFASLQGEWGKRVIIIHNATDELFHVPE